MGHITTMPKVDSGGIDLGREEQQRATIDSQSLA